MLITSRSNPAIVATAALKEKKFRERERLFVLEGFKLMSEAVRSGVELERVFATENAASKCTEIAPDTEIITVSESVYEKMSSEKSPQGVICVAKYIDKIHNIYKIYNMEDFSGQKKRVLLLSSLRDPGNLGTVIRSAAAFGCEEIILSSDCADIYNPKTVRAAMGTLFRQRISYVPSLTDTVGVMREAGYSVYSAVLDEGAVPLNKLTLGRSTAFVIGNEGHGIDPEVVTNSTGTVYIPMAEGVESLNASAAAAVIMWQSMASEL